MKERAVVPVVLTEAATPRLDRVSKQEPLKLRVELPFETRHPREKFEKLGFQFGARLDCDSAYVEAALPPGWEVRENHRPMWSDIVDTAGRVRVAVFSKPALDRSTAFMVLVTRIRVEPDFTNEEVGMARVCDGERFLHTEQCRPMPGRKCLHDARERAKEAALAWADRHWPQWRDVDAYWDVEYL